MVRRIIFGFLLIFSAVDRAAAQPAAISSGVEWLFTSQNTDKSWGGAASPVSPFNTTAAAVSSLQFCGNTGAAYNDGLTWLNGQTIDSVNFAAERILASTSSSLGTAADLELILNWRNTEGSWGLDGEYTNDLVEIALALQALKAVNYSDTTVLNQAISFLTTNQNSDGGWGFRPATSAEAGDGSNAYVTASVLRALAGYDSIFNVQDSILEASAYLLTKQNGDGGFGSSPSNVYETALSVMSLIESGSGNTQAILNGISYLASTQSPDGSWNQDPYYTALALQALASARPNLATSALAFSKTMPREGEEITVSATVSNTGFEDATGVVIRFYQGDPAAGGIQIGADQIVPSLGVGSSTQVSIAASFAGTGGKTIFVVVDPDGLISETSEADNKTSTRIWVATAPDLAVFSEDLKPSTYVPASGTAFTLEYTVRNAGESTAEAFVVNLYDGDPASGGTLLQTANISGLNGTEYRSGAFGVTLTSDGAHTLYLTVDPENLVPETSETNNTGSVTVQVGGTQQYADLAAGSIAFTPSRPTAGETVQVSASVRNSGVEDASNVTVEIFDNTPESGGTLIHSQTLSLAAGAEQTVTANWAVPDGIHDVYLIVDRMNGLVESDETNNQVSSRIMTDMVDISVSATDLSFSIPHPVSGDSVVLSVGVKNDGIKDTGPFTLALYDNDPGQGGTLLQSWAVANLASDGMTTLPYTFTAEPWTYRFYAVADTENVVTEMYEENNQAVRSLTVKAPGEALGPDLVPIKIDLSSMITDSRTLTVSGSAHVTFQNKGDAKIATSFDVLVFEDTDLDGRYTSGMDNLLGTGANTFSLWPEGAGMVPVPVSGTVKFLHSPVYAMIDSGDAVLEQSEDNNLMRTGSDCENRPTNSIASDIEVKWRSKSGPAEFPIITAYLTDDNSDGRIDEKDIPAILYMTYNSWPGQGRLWAVRGDTGATIFTYFDKDHGLEYESSIAAADVDGDGLTEIFVTGRTYEQKTRHLLAISNTGQLKWDNMAMAEAWKAKSPYNAYIHPYASPSIADIDRDGKPEIILGKMAVNWDGSIKWGTIFPGGVGSTNGGLFASQPVDLDLDGRMEVVGGNTAYDAYGNRIWMNTSIYDGVSVVGNFDDDAYPEIVLMTSTGGSEGPRIYLLDHNGVIMWGPVYIGNFEPGSPWTSGSPPVIADFDGDGESEIGVQGNKNFYLLDKNGALKKTLANPNGSFSALAPIVFDLDGDGRPEVFANTSEYFRIFNGKSGELLVQERFGAAGTFRNVTVADVNGDNQAEIIVTGYDNSGAPVSGGDRLRVYGSKNNNWVNARRIWNQNGYHVTNVNDDGTIPQYESPSWLLNNTYLCQARVGEGPNPYLTPNLSISYFRISQSGADADLTVRIGNGGAVDAPEGATVTFYDGSTTIGGTIGTTSTTRALKPGEYQDITLSVSALTEGQHQLYAVVDSGNAIPECDEEDNEADIEITIATGLPDLKVSSEDITLPSGAITEGSMVPITVNVTNIGAVSASTVSIRLYDGSPFAGGVQIGAGQTISDIDAGESASLAHSFDTLGRSGMNVLYVAVDQENEIAEANEANNLALVTLDVQAPTLPNLFISAENVQLGTASAQEGDAVTVTAAITNRGTATGNIPVKITVAGVQGPGSGSEIYTHTKTVYPILSLGQTETVSLTFSTTGLAGQYMVAVRIDPANAIAESSEDDNTASTELFVQASGLSAALSSDKTVYQANETLTASIAITNASSSARTMSLDLSVMDAAGNLIAAITQAELINLDPSGTAVTTKTWNIGKILSGQYVLTTELTENGIVVAKASGDFSIAPDMSVQAKAVTDKISYNPNETATLFSTITSNSPNYLFENLTAGVTVRAQNTDDRGVTTTGETVYSETKTITTLMPGASYTFKSYWNTGTYAPGTYLVTLEVKDASGAVIASSSASLQIQSSAQTGAGITGSVTATPNPVYQGREETLGVTVTNSGNEDITGVTTTIVIVDPETGEQKTEVRGQGTDIRRGETIAETHTVSTSSLAPRIYLAVLQVQTASMEAPKTLASASFEVKPGLEIAKTVPDVKNILLWVNASQAECKARDADPPREGDDIEEEACSSRIELVGQALVEAGAAYRIVTDKKDFQDELRNPVYTDFVILGDHNPMEDHFAGELQEQVYSGKGLISSLFGREDLNEELFGISFRGSLAGADYPVEIQEGSLGIEGSFPSYGKAVRVEAENPADVLGWITDNSGKEPILHPAIIERGYGKGKALFFAFDLGQSSEAAVPFTALVKESLSFIHAPFDPASLKPNQMVPVELTITSLGAAFDLVCTETYPEGTALYEPATLALLSDNPWVQNVELASGQTATIQYYVRTPGEAGSYTFRTEAGYLDNGVYAPYQTLETELTVTTSIATEEVLSSLQALTLKGVEASARDNAVRYLEDTQKRVVLDQSDREAMIADLLKAANSLAKIASVDVTDARQMVDSLLLFWEAEWYLSGK